MKLKFILFLLLILCVLGLFLIDSSGYISYSDKVDYINYDSCLKSKDFYVCKNNDSYDEFIYPLSDCVDLFGWSCLVYE